MFGSYPQRFEQQMVVVFLQFYGTTTTEEAPSGERFLDNRKFEGTVKEIQLIGNLVSLINCPDVPE
jgi:hypothetical protein